MEESERELERIEEVHLSKPHTQGRGMWIREEDHGSHTFFIWASVLPTRLALFLRYFGN